MMTKQLLVDIQTFNFHLLENFNPRKIRRGIFWGYFASFRSSPSLKRRSTPLVIALV